MADDVTVKVNDQPVRLSLEGFKARIGVKPILNIFGAIMQDSKEKTFREQGSPAGSWPALAPSTLKRRGFVTGDKILIRKAILKNSINEQIVVNGDSGQLLHGTNVIYARIHQEGGFAGRKAPKHKGKRNKPFHRPFIPARPYLVFRPEDPQRMHDAAETYIDAQAGAAGLKGGL
jgi:phage virion morphogenesis protein